MQISLTRQLGFQLLGVWLVGMGLFTIVPLAVPALGVLLAALAVCAGLLILIGR
jgi:hypothetical protein